MPSRFTGWVVLTSTITFLAPGYIGGAVAHGSGRDQANHAIAKVVDFANFNDCNIRTGRTASHEAIANHLSHVRQMNISVFYFTSVDSFTHGAVRLVRQTTVNDASFNHSGRFQDQQMRQSKR